MMRSVTTEDSATGSSGSFSDDLLRVESSSDGVTRMTLSVPGRRNCLSEEMLTCLYSALVESEERASSGLTRALVLSAEGDVFCAGHDLREIESHRSDSDGGAEYFRFLMSRCASVMLRIVRHPCPVIAEVDGLATAAGCQLVASCDLAVASSRSRFCTPGVHIGLFCSTPMTAVSRNVSRKHAMEMLLLGDPIDAAHAARIGLINRVAEDGELRETVDSMCSRIVSKAPRVTALGKATFYDQLEMPLSSAYERCAEVMTLNMLRSEAREGISAFLDKRSPSWPDPRVADSESVGSS